MTTTALALSFGSHDPAACIARSGKVLAYVEEERLSREKHAFGRFPASALREVIELAGISFSEIDCIAINWDLPRFESGEMQNFYAESNKGRTTTAGTLNWQRNNLRNYSFDAIQNSLRVKFKELGLSSAVPPIRSFPHHYIHAWHSFASSGYPESNVLVIDGSGDSESTSLWSFRGSSSRLEKAIQIPNSLGWFYAAITEFLGFAAYDGEHKVMAMSALGQPNQQIRSAIEQTLAVHNGAFELRPDLIHDGRHSFSQRFTDRLPELLEITPKLQGQQFLPIHFDLAYEAQRQLEQAAISFIKTSSVDQSLPLCLGGGVALNVTLGLAMQREFPQHMLFVNPLASDAGALVGAALRATCENDVWPYQGDLFLGRDFSQERIEEYLATLNLAWQPTDPSITASLLQRGLVIGWFQGRAEAGPRALGARSILCDPRNEHAMDRLTRFIKRRESWQPYGLSIPAAKIDGVLATRIASENMSIAAAVLPQTIRLGLRAVHADGTTRPHVVRMEAQPLLHEVLMRFGAETGVFALVNTSLNRKGEPIAYSPEDAVAVFLETQLDALIIGNCTLVKKGPYHDKSV